MRRSSASSYARSSSSFGSRHRAHRQSGALRRRVRARDDEHLGAERLRQPGGERRPGRWRRPPAARRPRPPCATAPRPRAGPTSSPSRARCGSCDPRSAGRGRRSAQAACSIARRPMRRCASVRAAGCGAAAPRQSTKGWLPGSQRVAPVRAPRPAPARGRPRAAGAPSRRAGASTGRSRRASSLSRVRTISTPSAPGMRSSFSMRTKARTAGGSARQRAATRSARVSRRLIRSAASSCSIASVMVS